MEPVYRYDRPTRLMGQAGRVVLVVGVTGTATWVLAGCGSNGNDLLTSVALPAEISNSAHEQTIPALPGNAAEQSGDFEFTPSQQVYLNALRVAGVQPSSELRALSIGSSICQAHAAGQTDSAVWDYVIPMVRSDVADARSPSPAAASDTRVNTVTADYIRVATQRLC